VSADAAIGGYGLLRTDLDNGGDVEIGSVFARGTLGTAFNAQWSGELMLRYSYEDWNFSTPNALGPVGPWGAIQSPGVGFSLRYAYSEKVVAFIGPQLDWNYETGASTADAQTYGATFGVTSVISPTLMLGIGGGVFRQINRTRFLPFVLVNWQIDDKWRLANPLQAGPTGGPGIELAYTISDQWEAAGGAAFRDERFRLRQRRTDAERHRRREGRAAVRAAHVDAVTQGQDRHVRGRGSRRRAPCARRQRVHRVVVGLQDGAAAWDLRVARILIRADNVSRARLRPRFRDL
jgi:hypothetical protein